ncbi:MAG TPA: hypothetical protein ENJ95_00910 [Bacteroidetes bacterium]|nr:hypothetical protein [Bacteroidota bacterium]
MDIQANKLELIKMILETESGQLLERLKNFIKQADKNGQPAAQPTPEPEWLEMAKQPMPASIDLEQLKKEQGYDAQKLKETFDNWDYTLFEDEPPIEELLKMLTK